MSRTALIWRSLIKFVGSFSSSLNCFTCKMRIKILLLCEGEGLNVSNPDTNSHCMALWLLLFVKLCHPLYFPQVIAFHVEGLLEEAEGTDAFRHLVQAVSGLAARNRTDSD